MGLQKLQTLGRNNSHHFVRAQPVRKTDETLMNLQQPQGTWAMNKRNSGMHKHNPNNHYMKDPYTSICWNVPYLKLDFDNACLKVEQ